MINPPAPKGITHFHSLLDFIKTIQGNKELIKELVMRDLRQGHARHILGFIWVYLQPIIIVLTFMLIFGLVLGSRINITEDFPGSYTSYLLSGLIPWFITAAILGKASWCFLGNSNLVKQVVFPIEVLPVSSVISTFIIYAPAFSIYLIYKPIFGGGMHLSTIYLLPIAVLLHCILAIGFTIAMSSLTPFINDIRELLTVYSSISMYFAPVIYLPDWVPAPLLPIIYLNPFSYLAWVYQDALFYGRIAHPHAWIIIGAMSLFSLFGGLYIFRKTKPFLGNVI